TRVSAAPLGHPAARAAAAAPAAFASAAAEPAGARGALLAVADLDRHRAVAFDPAGDVERGVAGVDQGRVLDVDRIAVGAITVALLGHDHHAPLAVEVAGRLHGRRGGNQPEAENGREGGPTEGGVRNHWSALLLGPARR